jgi:hypothetical protein
MSATEAPGIPSSTPQSSDVPPTTAGVPHWQRFPLVTFGIAALLASFTLLPIVRDNARLSWTFYAAVAALCVWAAVLWAGARLWNQTFRIELFPPARSHYIQGSVQLCIYAYWGWYYREVYAQAPLILAQLVFFYAVEGLVSWSHRRSWRLGFGPLPIILSTNVFLWFKPDWYAFQFLLIATAVLGKEFIRWKRDGRSSHVFNPSAFGLALFALVLLATNTTQYTWASQIADSIHEPPHIYLEIFLLGVIVQYFFSVTLMTLSAAATLAALNVLYTQSTGTYFFVATNIPVPVFLGLHLLVTDPATSPRTNVGKVIFGTLYGVLTFAFYGVLAHFDTYTIYDKLLPIPLLNLSVRWIDRAAEGRVFDVIRRLESGFKPSALNLAHMAAWGVLFFTMRRTDFIGAGHAGAKVEFWRQAVADGKPNAAQGLIGVLRFQARNGDTAALDELGLLYLQGRVVAKDGTTALRYFSKACKLGDIEASAYIAKLFLNAKNPQAGATVKLAFDQLEQLCLGDTGGPAVGAFDQLVGLAYETGHGRPRDPQHAREFYERGCKLGDSNCCASKSRLEQQGGSPHPQAK